MRHNNNEDEIEQMEVELSRAQMELRELRQELDDHQTQLVAVAVGAAFLGLVLGRRSG